MYNSCLLRGPGLLWKTTQFGRSSDNDAKTEAPCQGRCGKPRVTAGVAGPAPRHVRQIPRHGRCGRFRATAGVAGSASRQVWQVPRHSRGCTIKICPGSMVDAKRRYSPHQSEIFSNRTNTVHFNLEHFLDSRCHILKVIALHVSLLKLTWAFLTVIFCCLCRRYDRWRPC